MRDTRPRILVDVDGVAVEVPAGAMLAAALLLSRRPSPPDAGGRQRVMFCGMGLCFECWVTVDGDGPVRACLTPARPGMRVSTGRGAP